MAKAKSQWARLTENALDFLASAIDEFKDKPKYSIISFYTAVELFLKARLVHEHWSLIISKEPNRQKYEAGDFISVTFEGACDRLQNIVQSPVPESARKNFDSIRKHRNKMVHFFHDVDLSDATLKASIATEQLRAWYDLHKLLTVHWDPVFRPYEKRFKAIETLLSGHREFLKAKFDDLAQKIKAEKAKGAEFRVCGSCGFESAKTEVILGDLYQSECLVCRYRDTWFDYKCSSCNEKSPLHEGGEFVCQHCEESEDEAEITSALNEFIVTHDNYFEAHVPAHCAECEGYHSVVEYQGKYLCVMCFYVTDQVNACGYCGDFGNGDMEDSSMSGCTVCEGSLGNLMSKDD